MRKLSAAFAVASRPGRQTELSIWGTPNSADARATVAPPPGSNVSSPPMGASRTGRRTERPRKVEAESTRETSRRTRGALDALAFLPRVLRDGSRVDSASRSEEHTSELQSQSNLVCRLLLAKTH